MNRANQQQLFQATNQGLLGIRQSEINYYQSLNVAFGTQAALIGGFTYGVFSQNIVNHDNGYESVDILADVYWICSAITIAMAVHVILCTMLMQVLGPGLALNGPVGSMARATEGMRLEQRQIIVMFIAMMIMFSLATVLSCWVVMSFEAALGCSIAFAIAAAYWYYYCERIYLRFFWESEEAGWADRNSSFDNTDDPLSPFNNKLTKQVDAEDVRAAAKAQRRKHGRKGFFGKMFFRSTTLVTESGGTAQQSDSVPRGREDSGSEVSRSGGRSTSATGRKGDMLSKMLARDAEFEGTLGTDGGRMFNSSAPSKRGIVLEGYLTKRGGNGTKWADYRNEPWERRYFTLSGVGNLFIYKNRQDYRNDSKNPIYTRPLRLSDYYIEVFNMNDSKYNVSAILENDPANPYRFQMTLVLRENVDNPELLTNAGLTITADGAVPTLTAAAGRNRNGSNATVLTTTNGTAATSVQALALKQAMYRDHWVLQCDTEEELLLWVGTIRDLCPSCFRNLRDL